MNQTLRTNTNLFKWHVIAVFFLGLLSFPPLVQCQWQQTPVIINIENRTVIEILDSLSAITGYNFSYDASIVPEKLTRSLNAVNLPLKECLDSLLQDPSLRYVLIDKNIVISRQDIKNRKAETFEEEIRYLEGIIVDAKTQKSLPFATIAIVGTGQGTISNDDGRFILKIPPDTSFSSLVVSYIGYKNRYLDIPNWTDTTLTIEMQLDIISLQEIVIRYKDPANLLEEAISRFGDNYLSDFSTMIAYYRENVKKSNKIMTFSEAVLEIAKEPYIYHSSTDRVKIIKGRKSIDTSREDTIFMKIKSGVSSSLQLDIVKNLPDFMSEGFRKLYDYKLTDIVSYRDRLVYVISFLQKDYIKTALYKGELYLDIENLAILTADFQLNPKYISREKNMFIVSKKRDIQSRPISAIYHVEYKTGNEGYYLNQVRGEVKFRMRKRKQWLSSAYSLSIELAITDVNPGSRKRIPKSEQLPSGVILSEERFDNDPSFWGDYNIIAPEESLQEVLRKMKSEKFTTE